VTNFGGLRGFKKKLEKKARRMSKCEMFESTRGGVNHRSLTGKNRWNKAPVPQNENPAPGAFSRGKGESEGSSPQDKNYGNGRKNQPINYVERKTEATRTSTNSEGPSHHIKKGKIQNVSMDTTKTNENWSYCDRPHYLISPRGYERLNK